MEGNGIYTAMAEVMKDITAISKSKQCQQGGNFRYRGIDDVYNAINPLLGKYQIFVLPFCEGRNSEQRTTRNGGNVEVVTVNMKYSFCHADGSFVECRTIGEAMDSGDKATNKAMAIAHKYAILQTFCIPTEDMEDPDAQAQALAPRQTKEEIKQIREQAKAENQNPASDQQRKMFFALMGKRHGNNREAILKELTAFFGREVKSSNELTKEEIAQILNALNNVESQQQIEEIF